MGMTAGATGRRGSIGVGLAVLLALAWWLPCENGTASAAARPAAGAVRPAPEAGRAAAASGWGASTAGVSAWTREVLRTRVDRTDLVVYRVQVSGFVAGQPIQVWMRRRSGVVQLLTGDATPNQEGLLVSRADPGEAFLVLAPAYARNEPFELAIVTADQTVRAFTRAVPVPEKAAPGPGPAAPRPTTHQPSRPGGTLQEARRLVLAVAGAQVSPPPAARPLARHLQIVEGRLGPLGHGDRQGGAARGEEQGGEGEGPERRPHQSRSPISR
jgi:hypothetical protein